MKNFSLFLVACCLMVSVASHGTAAEKASPSDAVPALIRVATTEVSHGILKAAQPWYKANGLNIELIMTAGNVNVLRAVESGGSEAAAGVHIKFMENFNDKNNAHLVMIQPYPYTTGIGFYSEKHKAIEDLPTGAKIAIMNDPMNMHRGLKIMQAAGLIKLAPATASGYSLLDITENPKKIIFLDMDQAQTVRVLPELDGSIVFFTHMRNAGKDFRSFILRDTDAHEFPMGIVVRTEDAETSWATKLADGLRSKEARKFVNEKYDNVFEYLE